MIRVPRRGGKDEDAKRNTELGGPHSAVGHARSRRQADAVDLFREGAKPPETAAG